MARLYIAVLILTGVFLTFGGARSAAAAIAVSGGALYLSTLPSGADVWLDGAYVGTSPVLVDGLPAGRHSLSVTKAGWSVKDLAVEIDDQQTLMENLRLERSTARTLRATGTLAIRGAAGRKAWIDGIALGTAAGAAAILPAGSHTLAVQTERGKVTRRVTIYPDMTTNVVLRDIPAGRSPVVLSPIADFLPDASVAIENKALTIKYNTHTVRGVLGSQRIVLDGKVVWVDAAPATIGGKLYVPQSLVKILIGEPAKGAPRG